MRLLSSACGLALLAATMLPGAAAQPSGPGVRNAHAIAYHGGFGGVLLFGGADEKAVLGDTWLWDGESWRPLDLAGPSARTFPAFTWDAARAEAMLFGGRSVLFGDADQRGTFLSDTWTLGRDGWQRRTQADGPAGRSEAGIAYDSARRRIVLFGGYNDAGGETTRLGDTWEWDGVVWHLRARTGPEPRSGLAMAYDERLARVVLFGGSNGPRADTWTWDGRAWERLKTPPTPGRFNSLAAYDAARGHVVRTTGWSGTGRVRETWLFRHPRWMLAATDGPGARNHSALAFDPHRRRLVLHGGHDGTLVFGDTWEWDGTRWTERVAGASRRRVENGH